MSRRTTTTTSITLYGIKTGRITAEAELLVKINRLFGVPIPFKSVMDVATPVMTNAWARLIDDTGREVMKGQPKPLHTLARRWGNFLQKCEGYDADVRRAAEKRVKATWPTLELSTCARCEKPGILMDNIVIAPGCTCSPYSYRDGKTFQIDPNDIRRAGWRIEKAIRPRRRRS